MVCKVTNAETGTKRWSCCCDEPDHMLLSPLELVCGKDVEEFVNLS